MNNTSAEEIRILAPTGVCGSGFSEESFERGLANQPHFIGCDGGSTDPGPGHLGSGEPAFPRDAVKRDLRLLLLGARRLKIPLLLGSAGTAGRRRPSGVMLRHPEGNCRGGKTRLQARAHPCRAK